MFDIQSVKSPPRFYMPQYEKTARDADGLSVI